MSRFDVTFRVCPRSVPVWISGFVGQLHVVHHADHVRWQRVAVAGYLFAGHAEWLGAVGLRYGCRVRGPGAPEPAQQQRIVTVRAERVPQQLRHRVRGPAAGQPGPVLGQYAVPGPAGHDGRAGPVAARPRLPRSPAQQARGRLVRDEPGHGGAVAAGRGVRHRRHHGLRGGTSAPAPAAAAATATATAPAPAATAAAATATTTGAAAAAAAAQRRGRGRREQRDKGRATVHAPAAVHQLTQEISV